MFQKALAAGVLVFVLIGAPMALTAQEREVRAAEQASMLEWLAGLWSDLTAGLASQVVTPPNSVGDGRCDLDPNGCPVGAAAPALPPTSLARDGGCDLDPNGCPDGA